MGWKVQPPRPPPPRERHLRHAPNRALALLSNDQSPEVLLAAPRFAVGHGRIILRILTRSATSCCPSNGRAAVSCRACRWEASAVPPRSRSNAALSGATAIGCRRQSVRRPDRVPAKPRASAAPLLSLPRRDRHWERRTPRRPRSWDG